MLKQIGSLIASSLSGLNLAACREQEEFPALPLKIPFSLIPGQEATVKFKVKTEHACAFSFIINYPPDEINTRIKLLRTLRKNEKEYEETLVNFDLLKLEEGGELVQKSSKTHHAATLTSWGHDEIYQTIEMLRLPQGFYQAKIQCVKAPQILQNHKVQLSIHKRVTK